MIFLHQLAMMTYQLQRLLCLNANTPTGAHGHHVVQHVLTAITQEPDRDREIVMKHLIVNARIIYTKQKNVQLMTRLHLVSLYLIFGRSFFSFKRPYFFKLKHT